MLACGVSARVASRVLPHVGEGRVVVAVGAEDEALPLGAGGEVEDLKVVQRALQFLQKGRNKYISCLILF